MDHKNLLQFLSHHQVDLSGTKYWAPEVLITAFYDPCTDAQERYANDVVAQLKKTYGEDRWHSILRAMMLLVENQIPFQNRINGTINDNWLCKERFQNIAGECIFILSLGIFELEEWQTRLKEKFQEMVGIEPPAKSMDPENQ